MKIKLQQAADVLQKADEVLVLSHKSPDGVRLVLLPRCVPLCKEWENMSVLHVRIRWFPNMKIYLRN